VVESNLLTLGIHTDSIVGNLLYAVREDSTALNLSQRKPGVQNGTFLAH
jgi:hypothetical protein